MLKYITASHASLDARRKVLSRTCTSLDQAPCVHKYRNQAVMHVCVVGGHPWHPSHYVACHARRSSRSLAVYVTQQSQPGNEGCRMHVCMYAYGEQQRPFLHPYLCSL